MDQPSAQFPSTPPVFTQEPVLPEPPKKSFPKWPFIALFAFLLGIAAVFVYQKYWPARTLLVAPSPLVLPKPSAEAESADPTADWKTFAKPDWSFKYPSNLFAKEIEANFINLVDTENTPVSNARISIDARLIKPNNNYDEAFIGRTNNPNIVNPTISNIPSGAIISGKLGPGMGEGMPVIDGLIKYKNGAISIQSTNNNIDSQTFNLILSTFKFTPSQSNQSDPLTVAKEYLDAYIAKDWQKTKKLCGDSQFDESIAAGYGLVKYEITDSKADTDPKYFHVYIKLTNQSGTTFDKSSNLGDPLEVLMSKDDSGNWRALTWYFFQ